MTAFSAALLTLFSDPNLSAAATYRPKNGAAVTLRVLRPSRADTVYTGFETGASSPADRAEVRAADLARDPEEGDVLEIASERFTVRKAERDAKRLRWLLDLDRRV